MGASASIELLKPLDGSDIISSQSLPVAKSEIIRLRAELGHLAKTAGFSAVVYDASDLVFGLDEVEDFNRCCQEVIHIRNALRLGTQVSKRKARGREYVKNEKMDESHSDTDSDDN